MDDIRPSGNIRGCGDRELFDLVRTMRRYARSLAGNDADADDLVQETLKRALTYFEEDREIGNLRSYLFTILHNVRVDMLKRQLRAGTEVAVEETSLVSGVSPQQDRVICRQVIAAMQRLSEEHRQVLLLIGLEEMSYRETAEILGLPLGTVMSRLNRARTTLRALLGLEGRLELDGPP
ncbi:MAG TPA: RNA polymerase sigma factor [Paracoccaceae bacterium]|nr:RNA polymerase sigma factor [Paracoccaceae bacterium]